MVRIIEIGVINCRTNFDLKHSGKFQLLIGGLMF
jgi:hypothetical protein